LPRNYLERQKLFFVHRFIFIYKMESNNNSSEDVQNPSELEAKKDIAKQLSTLVPELKYEDALNLIELCKTQSADLSVPVPKFARYIKVSQKPEILAKELATKVNVTFYWN
jgi:hypothetical protein